MRVPKFDRLLPHQLHQFGAADAFFVVRGHEPPLLGGDRAVEIGCQIAGGKAGVILHFGRQGQLAQRQSAGQTVFLGEGPFEDQRLQCCAGGSRWRPPRRRGRCR